MLRTDVPPERVQEIAKILQVGVHAIKDISPETRAYVEWWIGSNSDSPPPAEIYERPSSIAQDEARMKAEAQTLFWEFLLCKMPSRDNRHMLQHLAELFLKVASIKGAVGYWQYHKANDYHIMLLEVVQLLETIKGAVSAIKEILKG